MRHCFVAGLVTAVLYSCAATNEKEIDTHLTTIDAATILEASPLRVDIAIEELMEFTDEELKEFATELKLDALAKRDRDVRNRVLLEREDAVRPAPADDVTSNVEITMHDDERVELTVRCSTLPT